MTRRRIFGASLASAAVGAALLALGWTVDPRRTCFAYLAAWTTGVTIAVGALLLVMVGHAAKASWMVVTRRISEAVAGSMILFAALFVPIALTLSRLYPWVLHPDEHKKHYLAPAPFLARSVAYFVVFLAVGALLRRWSRENDRRPSMVLVTRMRRLGGGGLPLVGLVLTWASFDWTMSLQPAWWSTIFGLYVFAGSFVGAIALVSVLSSLARRRADRATPSPDHAQALGRLLFAMVSFWAYMAFSQLLITWIGDLPAEATFYGRRTAGSWTTVTTLLVCGNFVAPFFALLNRRWKRNNGYLAVVGGWLVVMHFVDVYWLVLPVCDLDGARPHWVDLGAVLFVGGVASTWIARRYLAAPSLPVHDPELAEGLDYEAAV
ncbi:MAG TPA: hypothetical protein VGG39_10110 [Polyangiaceae bacterium]